MAEERELSGSEQMKRLYEEEENRTAKAFDALVTRDSFGELLAKVTENVIGLTKIATDGFDLTLRNLRLAGRQDITRLARQLARTEDKLELVLQEVERLNEQITAEGTGGRRSRNGQSSTRAASRETSGDTAST